MVFGTVRVQIYGYACGAREFASAVFQWFRFGLERKDTSHCCFPSVSYCPPANVRLLSDAQPADTCHRNSHASVSETLPRREGNRARDAIQVPEPTLWVQKAVMTGSGSNFARAHQPLLQSGIFRAGRWPFESFPFAVQVTDRSDFLDISDRASIPCSFRVRRVNALASETTLREG